MNLIPILAILLSGCASTTVYRDGKPVLHTQADMTNVQFSSGDVHFRADRLIHSTPTRAGGSVIGTATAGAASIIGTMGAATIR